MMALGGYATGYCLAPLRKTAIACVVIPFLPNALLLISSGQKMDVIPTCINHNSCAHWRRPMVMMRDG